MKLSTQRKVIAVFLFLVVGAMVLWGTHNVIEQRRFLEGISEAGWAIDTSPDSAQRDLRLTFTLLLGAFALWSRRGTKVALVTGLVVFAGVEFITWFIGPQNIFDRTEIEYHLLAGALMVFALILWLRGTNSLLIAMLPPAYVLLEYVLWYVSTIRMKSLLGVDQLQPTTTINNVLYGVHWWHLLIIALSLLMILFGFKAARDESST